MNGAAFPDAPALKRLRDSYWFLPAVMALAGLLAGIALVALDIRIGSEWLGRFDSLHGSRPEGARAMLSTIAGSTITVAGVVFSITLASVTYATGQYGARLLTTFGRDSGNQFTLGVFIGTYVYCLIVLRTIRSAGEEGISTAFVPQVAVYGALVMALASIAVLIYFFHHVTETIHINNVIARIGRKLIDALEHETEPTGKGKRDNVKDAIVEREFDMLIEAHKTGYIEAIDRAKLERLAQQHALRVRAHRRPGDFVDKGVTLFDAASRKPLSTAIVDALQGAVLVGDRRTDLQDLRFGFNELTEIAIRALSPGINDPFTAIACVHWLAAALSRCEKKFSPRPGDAQRDRYGIQALPLTFEHFVNASFGRLRQHVTSEDSVKAECLEMLRQLAKDAKSQENRSILMAESAHLNMRESE